MTRGARVSCTRVLGCASTGSYDPMGGLLPVRLRGRRLVDGGVYEAQPVVEGLERGR